MSTSGLPRDVNGFIEWVGVQAGMYRGDLNYRERNRIKADMMNVPERWVASRITPSALQDKCLAVGLKAKDAAEIADFLSRAQHGRMLRPRYINPGYRWHEDPTDD